MVAILEVRRDRISKRVINYYACGKFRIASAPHYVCFRIGDTIHTVGRFFGKWRYRKSRYNGKH